MALSLQPSEETWNDRVVEKMTFSNFRQEAWKNKVVETMTFNRFRQKSLNDRVA
jgi:hypothetical protein